MVKALFDTNILIDFLGGVPQAREEFDRYDDSAISIVTWMEVMVGAAAPVADATRLFLEGFALVNLDQPIAEAALALRCTHGMKLPDAVVWASAQVGGRLLVTRNTKDFPADDPGVRAPYKLRS
jgi:predicted nucleic acid-binding protein